MLLRPCASSSRCCCSTADTPLCALRRYGFVAYRERKHAQAAHAKLQEQLSSYSSDLHARFDLVLLRIRPRGGVRA